MGKNANSVLEMLKYVSSSMKSQGFDKPIIFMAGSAGEGEAINALDKRRRKKRAKQI